MRSFSSLLNFGKAHGTWSCRVKWYKKKTIFCLVLRSNGSQFTPASEQRQLIWWQRFVKYEIFFNFKRHLQERMRTQYLFLRGQSIGDSCVKMEQFLRWFGSSSWLSVVAPTQTELDWIEFDFLSSRIDEIAFDLLTLIRSPLIFSWIYFYIYSIIHF